MKKFNGHNQKRGIVMATILMMSVILLTIGIALTTIGGHHAALALTLESQSKAYAAAEAGLAKAIGTAKTVGDWNNLAAALTAAGFANKNYPDASDTTVYYKVSVLTSPAATSNTAVLASTGTRTTGANGGGNILDSITLKEFLHWQYPITIQSALYSSSYISSDGTPSIACNDATAPYVVSRSADSNANYTVTSCKRVPLPSDPGAWSLDVNWSNAQSAATANTVNNWKSGAPPAGVTGHYWSPSTLAAGATYNFSNLFGTTSDDGCGLGQTGTVGSNFFDATGVNNVTVVIDINSALTSCPASGPNFVAVRNANLTITGGTGMTYSGDIIYQAGNALLRITGTNTFDGRIYAIGGVKLQGGAGTTVLNFNIDGTPGNTQAVAQTAGVINPAVFIDGRTEAVALSANTRSTALSPAKPAWPWPATVTYTFASPPAYSWP